MISSDLFSSVDKYDGVLVCVTINSSESILDTSESIIWHNAWKLTAN